MEHIHELVAHPTVRHLLLVSTIEGGKAAIRLLDTVKGSYLLNVPLACSGVSSCAFSPDGSCIALACKDKLLRVFDPRRPDEINDGPSHDSQRPAKVLWMDSDHLVSTGFSKSANREVLVHSLVDANALRTIGRSTLDVSPAPLFPFYDPDTEILYVFAKGERICHALELELSDGKATLLKLPSFEHGTIQISLAFQPKIDSVDVKKIEVAKCFRLSSSTIEVVTFSIPRARVRYFSLSPLFIRRRCK